MKSIPIVKQVPANKQRVNGSLPLGAAINIAKAKAGAVIVAVAGKFAVYA